MTPEAALPEPDREHETSAVSARESRPQRRRPHAPVHSSSCQSERYGWTAPDRGQAQELAGNVAVHGDAQMRAAVAARAVRRIEEVFHAGGGDADEDDTIAHRLRIERSGENVGEGDGRGVLSAASKSRIIW